MTTRLNNGILHKQHTVRPQMRLLMQIIDLNPADIAISRSSLREDIGDVSGLAATIADQGMLQPLGVMSRPEGGYEIIYGHRRRSAALSLGLTQVPCLVGL